jgi:hypothetical protein
MLNSPTKMLSGQLMLPSHSLLQPVYYTTILLRETLHLLLVCQEDINNSKLNLVVISSQIKSISEQQPIKPQQEDQVDMIKTQLMQDK